MIRPQVIQVESQRVEAEREITGPEAEELLRSMGYGQIDQDTSFSTRLEPIQQNNDLSFEEMIKRDELKKSEEQRILNNKINGPKPITYNGSDGYDAETKWGSDDNLGFGFKIEITTDMKLPKY